MADIKISELGAASAVNNTDLFPITSAGVTVKATAQQIKNYIGVGNLSDLDTTDKSSAVAAINEVNTKVSKTEDLIAYVQTTLTASKAYAVGEQFIYNGLLYEATAAIAQGGTITINGNCTLADCVTEQIEGLNSNLIKIKHLGSGATTGNASYSVGGASLGIAIISLSSIADFPTNYDSIIMRSCANSNGVERGFINFDNSVIYIFGTPNTYYGLTIDVLYH